MFAKIAAPPMNLLGPGLVRDLFSLIQQAEADASIRVLVFQSTDPDYFISHVDVTRIAEYRILFSTGDTLLTRRPSSNPIVGQTPDRRDTPLFLADYLPRQCVERKLYLDPRVPLRKLAVPGLLGW